MTPSRGADYARAIDYVTGLVRAEPTPDPIREQIGLAPIRALLDALGSPHAHLDCVHIAGSKGKGTTALLTERILRGGGVLTGTYTSPHLAHWTERMRVDGRAVSEAEFARAVERVREAAPDGETTRPTFFDVLTAAALVLFAERGVRAAVLETGLGGRLDATNVVDAPLATCITTIELEHAERLGGTLEAIAREKAGIVKRGRPLALGRLSPRPRDVVLARAAALDAPVWSLADDARFERRGDAWRVTVEHDAGTVAFDLRHPSRAMADNAALAAACTLASGILGAQATEDASGALAGYRVPGRLDVVGERPLRVVDGAHTVESMRCLIDLLGELGARELRIVVSVTRGKDPSELLAPLVARASGIYVTSAEPSRSIPADELAAAVRALPGAAPVEVHPDPRAALDAALAATPADGVVCATGSLYLAGAALGALGDGGG